MSARTQISSASPKSSETLTYEWVKNASSKIEGPFDVAAIRGWIAGGRFTMEYQALEDHAQSADQMKNSTAWMSLEEIFSLPPSVPAVIQLPPKGLLEALREQSRYKALRLGADILATAGWAGCIGSIFWWHSLGIPQVAGLGFLLGQVLYAGLGAVVVAVLRLMLVLLADIGDYLFEQYRKR